MTRIFGQATFSDMVVLWTIETVVCFVGLCVVLHHGYSLSINELAMLSVGALKTASDALLLTILLGLPCLVLGLYIPSAILETRMLFVTAGVAAVCSVLVVWGAFASGLIQTPILLSNKNLWPTQMALYWSAFLVGTRLLYAGAMRSGFFVRKVVLIGSEAATTPLLAAIGATRSRLFQVSRATALDTGSAGRSRRLIVTDDDSHIGGRNGLASRTSKGLQVMDFASFWESQLSRIDLDSLEQRPEAAAAIAYAARETRAVRLLRRLLDIAMAVLLLILAAPLMLVTALLVKLESTGSVIYRQQRVGLGGQNFTILKFRSMRADAECNGVAVWAQVRDARVTRVGRFMRKTRIDELPQLINVLRGDMSLVGPRPERPCLTRELTNQIPFFPMRVLVKPGLTGWAQVNFAYTATTAEARGKLSYDLYYIKNRSLWLDLSVLLATIRVLIFQVGAR